MLGTRRFVSIMRLISLTSWGCNDYFLQNASHFLVDLRRASSTRVRLCSVARTFLPIPTCPQVGHGHGWNSFQSRPEHSPAPAQEEQNSLQPGIRTSVLLFLLLLLSVHFFIDMRKITPYGVVERAPRRKNATKVLPVSSESCLPQPSQ